MPAVTPESSSEFARALCAAQTRLHGSVLSLSLATSGLLAAVLTLVLMGSVPALPLAGWLLALAAAMVARLLLHLSQRRTAAATPSDPRWRRRYRLALLAQGCAWAVGGALLFVVDRSWQLDLLVFALVGVAAGALLTTSFDTLGALLYASPMAAPFVAYVFVHPVDQLPASLLVVALLLPVAVAAMGRERGALHTAIGTRLAQARRSEELRRATDLVDRTGAVAGVGGWELDAATRRLQLSPHALRLLDLTPGSELSLDSLAALFDTEYRPDFNTAVDAAISIGEPIALEVPLRSANGRQLMMRVVGRSRQLDGHITGIDGALQDVTRLHTIDRLLADKHQLLDQLQRTTRQGFWFVDLEGLCTDLNPAMSTLLGRSRDELLGRPVLGWFSGDSRELLAQQLQARREGRDGGFEADILRPDGSRRRCLVHGSPLRDARGRLTGSVGVWTDITHRHQAEEALRVSEIVINGSAEMISVVDEGHVYQMVNDTWCRMTGLAREQALGRRSVDVLPGSFSPARVQALEDCLRRRQRSTIRDLLTLGGSRRHLQTEFYPIDAPGGGKRMAALMTRDVTQEVLQHEALVSSTEYLRGTLDATGDAIFATDAESIDEPARFVNDQLLQLWDLPAELRPVLTSRHVLDRIRSLVDDPDAEEQRMDDIVAAGVPVEDRLRLTDGRVLRRRFACVWLHGRKLRVWSSRDITAETQAVAAREAAAAEQRALLDIFPGCIAVIDEHVRYQHVNERLARLMQRPVSDIVGRPAQEVLGEARWRKLQQVIEQTRRVGRVVTDSRYPVDGGDVDLEVTHVAGPRHPDGSQRVYAFGIDITERKRAQAALIDALAEAERANRAKSQFLSNMSHELRTPLNAVLGFGQLLARSPLAPEQQRQVGEIVHGGRHLLGLISDLLDLGRIEAGTLAVDCTAVDGQAAIDDSLGLMQPLALERGVTLLHVPVAGPLPAVWSDPQRLRQVLLNLLSHAIRNSRPGGEVRVETSLLDERVELRVHHHARTRGGDAPQHLLQPFTRLGDEGGAVDGTGIGLALTKDLVAAMGGAIGVRSTPGEGSQFWVQLLPSTASPASGPPPLAPAVRRDRTALYIEDNPVNLMLMAAMLEDEFELVTESDPLRGLDLARLLLPDLILLDIQLPGMDGYEVLRELRADPRTQHIPVVAVSANAMPSDLASGQHAGFDAYLTKPLDLELLLGTVRRLADAAGKGPA